jgi:hypothetical protein
MGKDFGGGEGDCPVTEDVSDRLIRLPLHHTLTEADLDRVVSAIREFEIFPANPKEIDPSNSLNFNRHLKQEKYVAK